MTNPPWPLSQSAAFAFGSAALLWAIIAALIVLAFLFFAPAASAAPVILPPPEFDHPFAGRLIVETLPLDDVIKACPRSVSQTVVLPPGMYFDACSWRFPDWLNGGAWGCHIILPIAEDVEPGRQKQLKRHEIGHCNFWGPEHSDGHFEDLVP